MNANKETGKIEFTPTKLHNYKNDLAKEIQKHTLPSPETKKLIQNQVEKLEEVKKELEGNLEEINNELTTTFMNVQKEEK